MVPFSLTLDHQALDSKSASVPASLALLLASWAVAPVALGLGPQCIPTTCTHGFHLAMRLWLWQRPAAFDEAGAECQHATGLTDDLSFTLRAVHWLSLAIVLLRFQSFRDACRN